MATRKNDAARRDEGAGAAEKRFEVALSFAGEVRPVIAEIAEILAGRFGRDRVLYNKFHEAELARADLDVYLTRLYREQSVLVVVFLTPDYAEKRWCRLEMRHMRDVLGAIGPDGVMFVELERGGVYADIGLTNNDGSFDGRHHDASRIEAAIAERWCLYAGRTVPRRGSVRKRPTAPPAAARRVADSVPGETVATDPLKAWRTAAATDLAADWDELLELDAVRESIIAAARDQVDWPRRGADARSVLKAINTSPCLTLSHVLEKVTLPNETDELRLQFWRTWARTVALRTSDAALLDLRDKVERWREQRPKGAVHLSYPHSRERLEPLAPVGGGTRGYADVRLPSGGSADDRPAAAEPRGVGEIVIARLPTDPMDAEEQLVVAICDAVAAETLHSAYSEAQRSLIRWEVSRRLSNDGDNPLYWIVEPAVVGGIGAEGWARVVTRIGDQVGPLLIIEMPEVDDDAFDAYSILFPLARRRP